jgi:hypothetical protein
MNRLTRAVGTVVITAAAIGAPMVAAAQPAPQPARQVNGAAGLVAAVVALEGNQVGLVNVGNSLNNLTALNNVLNNSPILSNNNVTVTDILSDITVSNVLNELTALNNNDINVAAVVALVSLQDSPVTLLVTALGGVLVLV